MSSEDEGGDGNEKNSNALSNSMVKRKNKEPFSSEDEAWRSYLENPSMDLKIVASDEVSIYSKDTAGALATLYEYYKVPPDKRTKIGTSASVNSDFKSEFTTSTSVKIEPEASLVNATSIAKFSTALLRGNVVTSDGRLSDPRQSPDSFSEISSSSKDSPRHEENYSPSIIHCMENPDDLFHYSMEAPKSLKQKETEPTMSYINKTQFYCITLRSSQAGSSAGSMNNQVRSIVSVVFGDGKGEEEQLKHWKYWHSRQHTAKQRGMPLLLQIDTYSDTQRNQPIHRAACQIKVFCDKGAERKIRDEERKALRKKQKSGQYTILQSQDLKVSLLSTGRKHDVVYFRTIQDTSTRPVYFTPESNASADPISIFQSRPSQIPVENEPSSSCLFGALNELSSFPTDSLVTSNSRSIRQRYLVDESDEPTIKCPKQEPPTKILLYVRKENEDIFDALMLKTPTVQGLQDAISEKYAIDPNKIVKIYKKQKRGILVNMDDNIIEHYSHEDTFIIDFIQDEDGNIKITLIEFIV